MTGGLILPVKLNTSLTVEYLEKQLISGVYSSRISIISDLTDLKKKDPLFRLLTGSAGITHPKLKGYFYLLENNVFLVHAIINKFRSGEVSFNRVNRPNS